MDATMPLRLRRAAGRTDGSSPAVPSTPTSDRAALTAERDDTAEHLAGMVPAHFDTSGWEVVPVPDDYKCISTDDVPDVEGVNLRRLLLAHLVGAAVKLPPGSQDSLMHLTLARALIDKNIPEEGWAAVLWDSLVQELLLRAPYEKTKQRRVSGRRPEHVERGCC